MSLSLREIEKSNSNFDSVLKIKDNEFTSIDDFKIYILKENKDARFFNVDLEEMYCQDKISYSDYWHLRDWFFMRDLWPSDEELVELKKLDAERDEKIRKEMEPVLKEMEEFKKLSIEEQERLLKSIEENYDNDSN